jgi:hypothetical protein
MTVDVDDGDVPGAGGRRSEQHSRRYRNPQHGLAAERFRAATARDAKFVDTSDPWHRAALKLRPRHIFRAKS